MAGHADRPRGSASRRNRIVQPAGPAASLPCAQSGSRASGLPAQATCSSRPSSLPVADSVRGALLSSPPEAYPDEHCRRWPQRYLGGPAPRNPAAMTQPLLFDLPAPLAPPQDLADAYLLPSAPAPHAAPARQLLLAPAAPETAASVPGGIQAPPPPSAAAELRLARDSRTIPASCPVTGGRTCHRDGCYHFHAVDGGRCSHPQAGKPCAQQRR